MQLEDYFEFETCDTPQGPVERIRLKGHRIAIEHILDPYLQGDSPERIFQSFRHTLTLEKVYATITYYLQNRARVDEYLRRHAEFEEAAFQEYVKREPPEVVKRLRALAAEQRKSRTGS
jgi:uncharacterized protein (DUF433 family)